MNLVFFKLTSGFFGGEKQTADLLDGLKARGHTLLLITLPDSELYHQLNRFDRLCFNLFPYPTGRVSSTKFALLLPFHWLRGLLLAIKLKRDFKIQAACLQEPYEKIVFTPVLKLLGIRVIWLELLYWQPYLSSNHLIFPLLIKISRWTDRVIVTSSFLFNQLSQYLPKSRLRLIKHALKFGEQKQLKSLSTNFYPIRTIGFAGSLTSPKGIFVLLEAFKLLIKKKPKLKLLFAGTGSDSEKLIEQIKSAGLEKNVKLLGKIPIKHFFERVQLLVVPSIYDNLPYIIQEAIFARIPVIATKTGGIIELFPTVYHRFLAKPNNQINLVDKLNKILKLKEKNLKDITEKNLAFLVSHFSYQKMLDLTEVVFSDLFKAPSKNFVLTSLRPKLNLYSLWKRYRIFLFLSFILVIGLFFNQISPYRLPPGEDDMFYLGQVRKTVDLGTEHVSLGSTFTNLKTNTVLFYTLGYLWQNLFSGVDYLLFFNTAYFVFYLVAFASFLRLALLTDNRFFRRCLLGLWFVLLISNTFWLGTRYFVPSFWLYISIPNIIFATNQKRWWEMIFWIVSTYIIYWYGWFLSLGIVLITLLFKTIRSFKIQLTSFLLVLFSFYYFGLPMVDRFLKAINFQSIFVPDIAILNYLFIFYCSLLVFTLIVGWLRKSNLRWDLIFTSLTFSTIFYWIIVVFPNDTAAYRLIIIFYVAMAMLISALPNGLISLENQVTRIISLISISLLLLITLTLFILNFNQNQQDFNHFAIRPEEVELFDQLKTQCLTNNCLLVTDIGTDQLASFFLPFARGQANYESRLFRAALDEPLNLLAIAQENQFDKLIVIASKRTSMLYKISLSDTPDQWISRSYFLKLKDPLEEIPTLNRYSNFLAFANYEIGLYAYIILVNTESTTQLSVIPVTN